MTFAIHITHEAVQKVGGIGTVINGLITAKKYNKTFKRTLLYAPVFDRNTKMENRLGKDSTVLYSGLDNYDSKDWSEIFKPIEDRYNVKIVFGKKTIFDPLTPSKKSEVDIIIADIWDMKIEEVNAFKFQLWKYFGIESNTLEHDRDFEQYLRIGAIIVPIYEALHGNKPAAVFSHEYMGMPGALSFEICKKEGSRSKDTTIFYAHEVSTARTIVENHAGHDLSFYNILKQDVEAGISMEQEFGYFPGYSRNEIVKRAHLLDYIFAVSDITKSEYLYLVPSADKEKIKVIYNAVPVMHLPYSDKEKGTGLMREYCKNLFSFTPDYIFTHVTRLIISKGLWRDIRFLYHIDELLHRQNKTGFFVMLSSLISTGRPNDEIHRMEAEYGWPVMHKEGWPDLVDGEIDIYKYLELFNSRSKAIKGVFINQFGFSRETCGERMPEGSSILNLRLASDIEFGLSIYEPFGIAQLETIPYGGVAVLSSVCGCADMLKKNVKEPCHLIIDFTEVPHEFWDTFRDKSSFVHMSKEARDLIETEICAQHAPEIVAMLPKNDAERKQRFAMMQKKSAIIDWENSAEMISRLIVE